MIVNGEVLHQMGDAILRREQVPNEVLRSKPTVGMGKELTVKTEYSNYTGRPVLLVFRTGMRTVLKDQRYDKVPETPGFRCLDDLSPEYRYRDNTDKPLAVIIRTTYIVTGDTYMSFRRWYDAMEEQERIERNLFKFTIPYETLEHIGIKLPDYKGGPILTIMGRQEVKFEYLTEISLRTLEEQRGAGKHIYHHDQDIVLSLDIDNVHIEHPYSIKADKERDEREVQKEAPDLVGVEFIDSSGDNSPIFVRRLGQVVKVKPVRPNHRHSNDGIYIKTLSYVKEQSFKGNQANTIRVDYSDTATLEKYGIYKTYYEAISPDKPKIEQETIKLKYDSARLDKEIKSRDDFFNKVFKFFGYLSSIVCAVVPLILKFKFGAK